METVKDGHDFRRRDQWSWVAKADVAPQRRRGARDREAHKLQGLVRQRGDGVRLSSCQGLEIDTWAETNGADLRREKLSVLDESSGKIGSIGGIGGPGEGVCHHI